jgi:ElaB/YqjD/DUF883 family membrane-anchored ribosome-binding protein
MSAKEQIIEKKNQITTRAREIASSAEDKANEITTAAGEKIEHASDKMRQGTDSAATRLNRVGQYLQERDVRDIGRQLTGLVRKYPVPTLAVGLVAGFLVGRGLGK